jgi:hypothetical protein|tara:strand:- start:62 stop:223 length:162 start_codon:yes stop_codon:yes gene_type:complete
MIPQALIKLILPKLIDQMMKVFKLDKVLSYVEKPNELDHKVKDLETRIKKLES